jgi:hypothetical protein
MINENQFKLEERNRHAVCRTIDSMREDLEEFSEFQGAYAFVYDYLIKYNLIEVSDSEKAKTRERAERKGSSSSRRNIYLSTVGRSKTSENEINVLCKELYLMDFVKTMESHEVQKKLSIVIKSESQVIVSTSQ